MIDFGQGQGPKGGVVTVKDGWVAVQGAGEARLAAGQDMPGGAFPPNLTLTGKGKKQVEISLTQTHWKPVERDGRPGGRFSEIAHA